MELIKVQMALASVDSRLVCWLEWKDENGFIKAYPRRRLSMQARKAIKKVFKGLGGRHVFWDGEEYYELAKMPRLQSGRIALACRKLVDEGIFGKEASI